MFTALSLLLVGLLLLAYAADQFVIGAGRLSRILGVPPVVVGVVIVGFGTSLPELLVSGLGAAGGEADAAFGNAMGSNIANLTLILGTGALIHPLAVSSRILRREIPLSLVAMALAAVGALLGGPRLAGVALLVSGVAFIVATLRASGGEPADALGADTDDLLQPETHTTRAEGIRTALGLIGTVAGAQMLLTGALALAEMAGLSGGAVGATIVAVGTSLPELVTVVQAARRNEPDLVLGNLWGSNLFNSLIVTGVSFTVSTTALTTGLALTGAVGIMVGAGVLAALLVRSNRTLTRVEGAVLLLVYAASLPVLLATG
ncbi:calcium/sodium antiporter [soil metagenome]